jgi:hypothetical protein
LRVVMAEPLHTDLQKQAIHSHKGKKEFEIVIFNFLLLSVMLS